MSSAARFQAAAAIVRRLNAAVKSRRLYAAGHPLRTQTAAALLDTVQAYHQRYGSFVLETHREGLVVEGKPFEGGESIDHLALQLYAMGVWQLVVVPGLTEAEAGELLDVVCTEREELAARGGIVALLAERGVTHLRVVELRPGEEDVAEITPEFFQRLLDGSLSLHDRALLLGLLRGGADQAGRLVAVVVERARQAFPDARGQELAGRIYEALTALDRLIVDTPPGESQELLKRLAGAVAEIEDPTQGGVPRTILAQAGHDLSARALLTAMTSEQIARMVIPCLEAGEPPPQAAQVAQGLPFDPEKARETLALISQRTGRSFDVPALLEELSLPRWIHNFPQDLADFQITSPEVAVTDDEIAALVAEARTDEPTLRLEHTLLLLRLAAEEEDAEEREGALELLGRLTLQHLQEGAFDLAATVLRRLRAMLQEPGPRAEAARFTLRTFLGHLPGTLTVRDVWGWTDGHPLLGCLKDIGATAAAILVQALPQERDAARRQVVAAILAKLGDEAADSLGRHLGDPHVETVRCVIQALGQMRTPRAVRALRGVAGHADAALRREAVEALRTIQIPEAQETLLAFLRDPDPQIRAHCIAQLHPDAARRASWELVAMLGAPELADAVALKIQICDTLVRARALEVAASLRRHASPFRLRRRDREVARHVRAAVASLSRMPAAAGGPRRAAS